MMKNFVKITICLIFCINSASMFALNTTNEVKNYVYSIDNITRNKTISTKLTFNKDLSDQAGKGLERLAPQSAIYNSFDLIDRHIRPFYATQNVYLEVRFYEPNGDLAGKCEKEIFKTPQGGQDIDGFNLKLTAKDDNSQSRVDSDYCKFLTVEFTPKPIMHEAQIKIINRRDWPLIIKEIEIIGQNVGDSWKVNNIRPMTPYTHQEVPRTKFKLGQNGLARTLKVTYEVEAPCGGPNVRERVVSYNRFRITEVPTSNIILTFNNNCAPFNVEIYRIEP